MDSVRTARSCRSARLYIGRQKRSSLGFVQPLESRQLLTVPTFGWTLNTPATIPVAWMNGSGTGLTTPAAFSAENLNNAAGSFRTSKGTDGSGRNTFGPASGLPADGNYEFTVPSTSFSPALGSDVQTTSFFVRGDLNHDRVVDSADNAILYANFDSFGSKSYAQGDIDGDGDVDQTDYDFITSRYNTRLAPAPTYEGEVTVSSLAIQPDGSSPLEVNWEPISDATVQASDPSNATKTIAGYTVYRSTDGTTFTQTADVMRSPDEGEVLHYVYRYNDPTPVDGTKYWYRIRPFYAVTQPDGSSGFQHLPTTNKAWRVSAMKAASYVDAVYANDEMFISWTDNSLNESGYTVDINIEGSLGMTTVTQTLGADATSTTADLSAFSMWSDVTYEVVVTAVNDPLSIGSAPSATNAVALVTSNSFDAGASARINLNPGMSGYVYNAGTSHANETVQIVDDSSHPTNLSGSYLLNGSGIAILPFDPSVKPTAKSHLQIHFASQNVESTIAIGPEPYGYGTVDKIRTTATGGTTQKGTGIIINNGHETPIASVTSPTFPPPVPTGVSVAIIQSTGTSDGGAQFDIVVTLPAGSPPMSFDIIVTIRDIEDRPIGTIRYPVQTV